MSFLLPLLPGLWANCFLRQVRMKGPVGQRQLSASFAFLPELCVILSIFCGGSALLGKVKELVPALCNGEEVPGQRESLRGG